MLIPLILPKGYSLDASSWTTWFEVEHEHTKMQVSTRKVDTLKKEVKVELVAFGVAHIRGIFAFAEPDTKTATYYHSPIHMPFVENWLRSAFQVELVHNGAPMFSCMRQMGWAYLSPGDLDDISKYVQEKSRELHVQGEHFLEEQSGGSPAEEQLSAFLDTIEDLDFTKGINDD